MAVVVADPLGQPPHLLGVEVIDLDRDADPAEPGHEFGGLLDGLGPVVVGGMGI